MRTNDMKWAVEIQRTGLEIRNLEDILKSLNFRLFLAGQNQGFTSDEMDQCANEDEVNNIAKQLREAMKVGEVDTEFSLGPVIDYRSDPVKRIVLLEATSSMQINTSAMLSSAPAQNLSEVELHLWHKEKAEQDYQIALRWQLTKVVSAYRSETAKEVLNLFKTKNQTGLSLFKIYELMEDKASKYDKKAGTAFRQRFDISEEQFRRFSDAVHNPSATGYWARHSVKHTLDSDNPMTQLEAQNFIRDLAERWLRTFL